MEIKTERSIYLLTDINEFSAGYIINELLKLDEKSKEDIYLFINSPGGNIKDMLAIMDIISNIKSRVIMIALGIVASASAVLFITGNYRVIGENAEILLHKARFFGLWDIITEENIKDYEEELIKANEKIKSLIEPKLKNINIDELFKTISEDTIYNAEQSVFYGFADEIIENNSIKNKIKKNIYNQLVAKVINYKQNEEGDLKMDEIKLSKQDYDLLIEAKNNFVNSQTKLKEQEELITKLQKETEKIIKMEVENDLLKLNVKKLPETETEDLLGELVTLKKMNLKAVYERTLKALAEKYEEKQEVIIGNQEISLQELDKKIEQETEELIKAENITYLEALVKVRQKYNK